MKFLNKKFVKLRGLNKRTVAVDVANVVFLEEHELNGELVTNVHMHNGKWISSGLSLDEVEACLNLAMNSDAEEEKAEQLEKWKKMARDRRIAEKEAEEAVRVLDLKGKIVSWSSEVNPINGIKKLTVELKEKELEPEEVKPELEKMEEKKDE